MQAVVERFVEAVGTRNSVALRTVVGSDARMRALIPPGLFETQGPDEVAEQYEQWFGWRAAVELDSSFVENVGDRWHFAYRLRLRDEEGGPVMLCEQHGFCDVVDGFMICVDLVCSGVRPLGGGETHSFDAGSLGCADGLAQEFRRRLMAIEIGDVLEVTARDPAAKEDLPSLARLGGHKVLSTEAHDDGRLTISVERGR